MPEEKNAPDNDTRLADADKVVKAQSKQLDAANKTIADLKARLAEAEKAQKFAETKVETLEKKLKAAKSAPTGDVVYIDGKTWTVKGTVRASDALDHVKKGYLEEDVSLIITDRRE